MFQEWGFLLTELWGLLALAAIVGLLAGWLIFGRGDAPAGAAVATDSLRADLERCRDQHAEKDRRIADLEAQLRSSAAQTEEAPAPVTPPVTPVDFDGDGVVEGKAEGTKPRTLDGPVDGIADDLKRIKGIGPKLEKLCNSLGFYHFDQIAAWTEQEVAWVDANLEGFSGRVTRDEWVEQAKLLAAGGETAFSRRVAKGDMY